MKSITNYINESIASKLKDKCIKTVANFINNIINGKYKKMHDIVIKMMNNEDVKNAKTLKELFNICKDNISKDDLKISNDYAEISKSDVKQLSNTIKESLEDDMINESNLFRILMHPFQTYHGDTDDFQFEFGNYMSWGSTAILFGLFGSLSLCRMFANMIEGKPNDIAMYIPGIILTAVLFIIGASIPIFRDLKEMEKFAPECKEYNKHIDIEKLHYKGDPEKRK